MVSSKEMKIAREHNVAAVSLSGLNSFNCVSLTDSMFYLDGLKTRKSKKNPKNPCECEDCWTYLVTA